MDKPDVDMDTLLGPEGCDSMDKTNKKKSATNSGPGRNSYVETRDIVLKNMREGKDYLLKQTSPTYVRWAPHWNRFTHMPRMLDRVCVIGYENLPHGNEPAPILAFSHKKLHDFLTVSQFMMARSFDKFHKYIAILEGGSFNGITVFRDLIPDRLKHGLTRRWSVKFSKSMGAIVRNFLLNIHWHPIYRPGKDIPNSREEYESDGFAGPDILNLDYDKFKKSANQESLRSIKRVQHVINEENGIFIIAPEGGYCGDGSVKECRELLGLIAFKTKRNTAGLSIAYDELCPDSRGRMSCWLNLSTPVNPPAVKDETPTYLDRVQKTLQRNTVVLASHLIARTAKDLKKLESFTRDNFEERYNTLVDKIVESDLFFDPGLVDTQFRKVRLMNFFKSWGKKWFKRKGDRFFWNHDAVDAIQVSQRTVCVMDWNINNARHAFTDPGI